MNKEDEEVFNSYIRPFFKERGLPSSDSFLREITELFIDASQRLIYHKNEEYNQKVAIETEEVEPKPKPYTRKRYDRSNIYKGLK